MFWVRGQKFDDIVPISVASPIKKRKKGHDGAGTMAMPEYFHRPCVDRNDPAKGKIVNFFHDDFGRRVGI